MDVVDRLHQRLEEAVARDGLTGGLTIRSLYQQLVPYRAVRGDLDLWELAQYEHALLRLLSGERGHLQLTDPRAHAKIERELASPNPILGIYRDYPDVGVRLGHDHGDPDAPGKQALPELRERLPVAPAPPPIARGVPAVPPPAPAPACRDCRHPLPPGSGVRFCPACGADQTRAACATCSTPLRAEWNFCIRCGQRRTDKQMFTGG